ncbi:PREDICTED: MATH domain and coiled-coil domain-containing protein At2g42465 [Camelina sativa]|uniref:MATH domain and coiled-coil domain-containing protein At2g42465 n=1 Tax=Camelina sativa TaxID=90675 RepID=A0ABM0WRQ8_CAMSA|nr:PREDICTED: MATH domain and coiled-coil domain-containing protein At2g42465 [Camelina sativa]XP_010475219.1 PREDICTED: MATH domain and coiled-coil domain-containing protein At2g42465 [Camelina sativa]XP_010475220.1 PREDICTED: MATH domain and coiled-coil domain-containing protein At2g42465 [Camelina sativa]
MGTEFKTRFSWEIDNFSDIKKSIRSGPYLSGSGCQWFLELYPKGYCVSDHVSLRLSAYNPKSLRLGWKRRVNFLYVFLNQSGEELYRSNVESCRDLFFCAEVTGRIFSRTSPLNKLQEEGFLKENKLTIKFNIEVTQVVHQGKSTENDIFEFYGVQILASQGLSMAKVCGNHPCFEDFNPKTKEMRAVYFTIFFCLIETLRKSPQSLSVTELRNAQNQFTELTKAGFKLDFLKSKLKEASSACQVQNLPEEWVKNVKVTVSDLQAKLGKVRKEKIRRAAASSVLSFGFMRIIIKKFFLSCFSV